MWDRACVDSASVPTSAAGEHAGGNPTYRGKHGCKDHLLLDERGLPLVARISGAEVHDSRFLIRFVESIPAVKRWQDMLANAQVKSKPIGSNVRFESPSDLAAPPGHRSAYPALKREVTRKAWTVALGVERTLGWLFRFRRLRIRHERRADMHQASM